MGNDLLGRIGIERESSPNLRSRLLEIGTEGIDIGNIDPNSPSPDLLEDHHQIPMERIELIHSSHLGDLPHLGVCLQRPIGIDTVVSEFIVVATGPLLRQALLLPNAFLPIVGLGIEGAHREEVHKSSAPLLILILIRTLLLTLTEVHVEKIMVDDSVDDLLIANRYAEGLPNFQFRSTEVVAQPLGVGIFL